MNINHYIIGIGITIILIYFAYDSNNLEEWINNVLELINILPLPDILKKIIFYLRYKKNSNINNKKFNKPIKRFVTPLQKKIVASNQKWRCNLCGQTLDYTYEVDHINPLFKGGGNNNSNLQALCRNCHGKKTINDNYIN